MLAAPQIRHPGECGDCETAWTQAVLGRATAVIRRRRGRRSFGLIYTGHPDAALAHFAAGRYAEAIRYPQMVLDERPGMTWPYRDLEGAKHALEQFVYLRPPMTLASIADGLKFMEKPLLDRYIEGLRMAGME